MTNTIKFKAFCIERYKYKHNMRGKETLYLFNQYGVMDYIGEFYDELHTYGDNYIVEDIDQFIAERRQDL